MNNDRRKDISEVQSEIRKAQSELEALRDMFRREAATPEVPPDGSEIAERRNKIEVLKHRLEDLQSQLENTRDEEQDAHDNLPESL